MTGILTDALCDRRVFTQALFKRPESLSKYFVYDEYVPSMGIYINRDGSLGAVFEAALIEHEPLSGEEIVEKIGLLRTWFQLPSNAVLQVIHEQTAISPRDRIWKKIRDKYPAGARVSNEILDQRISNFKKRCLRDSDTRPLRRKTYVCLKFFPDPKLRKRIKNSAARSSAYLLTEVKESIHVLRDFKDLIDRYVSASKVTLSNVTPQELIDSLRQFLNPNEYFERDFAEFNPNASISSQLLYSKPNLSYAGIEREGVKTRTVVLKVCPRRSTPGAVANFLQLPFPFRLSMNFSFPEKMAVNRTLDLKAFFLQTAPSASAQRQKSDLDRVQSRIADGDKCVHMTLSVVIEGSSDEELKRRELEIVNVFQRDLESEVIVDQDVGLALCLNSLPLMYSPESDSSLQRHIKILDSEILNFLPIFDSYKGNGDPLQLYLSRENNIVEFSVVDPKRTSNHTIILADTGGGKSELVLDMVQAYKRRFPDPLIFYVEKMASSKALCEAFGGEVTVFHPNEEIPFTPFRGHFDDSKVQTLSLIILTAIKLTSPKFEAESEHSAILTQALKDAHQRKVEQQGIRFEGGKLTATEACDEDSVINMDDVLGAIGDLHDNEAFKEMRAQIDEMVLKLRDFTGDGKYASLTRGSAGSRKPGDCSFYVFDLAPVDSDPILKAILTMCVFEEIKRIIALPENKGRGGMIVFEEMGQLGGNNPTAAQYIKDFAETIRKLKFWLIGIAPSPRNFLDEKMLAGRALWEAADNFVFLNMKPDNVEYVRVNSEVLNETTAEIVRSLVTLPDQYAEVFYTDKAGKHQGAFRFIQARALSNYADQPQAV